jgi:hypothetical protein
MYKRRFVAPLHQNTANTNPASTSASHAGLPKTDEAAQDPGAPATASTVANDTAKENVQPAEGPVVKKPRLFMRPSSAPTAVNSSTVARPSLPAAAKPCDAGAVQTFSVLYCKRDKFKVRGSSWAVGSGLICWVHAASKLHAPRHSCPCLTGLRCQ